MTVPLLLTMDLELAADREMEAQREVLDRLRGDLAHLEIEATIFATADAVDGLASEARRLSEAGHEFGLHGVTHGPEEDFRRLDSLTASEIIDTGSSRLARQLGRRPRCFRGPSMTTSAVTQEVLVEQGFVADLSVCSQRFDIVTSKGGSPGWLRSPRGPYHPAVDSPFRRGDRSLWVVPLVSLGLPPTSATLYLGGLRVTKRLCDVLLAELRRLERPLVYLFHSYEFVAVRHEELGRIPRRQRPLASDGEQRYRLNLELIRYLVSRPDVSTTTVSRVVETLDQKEQEAA